MNQTKVLILEKSAQLFNQKGISATSLRDIATKAEMSVGNLQYHFKKREIIVETLYFQLVEKMNFIQPIPNDDLLNSLFLTPEKMLTIFYEYRFFLLDFTSIVRKNNKINQHYSELSKQRELDFIYLMNQLTHQGLLRQERLKNEFRNLYKRIEILSNFWFSSCLIRTDKLSIENIHEFSTMINQSIYPYLTEEGKAQCAKYFK